MNKGTNLMVKNLFFNVPARRHFLKSTTTEFRHILDEFTRIALAFPHIGFRLWHNGVEQYHLSQGNLKSRVIALLGSHFEKKLVPVEQRTEVLNIFGFVGKPETATRTRGNQFFFINGRFIRNSYLNHAVTQSYESLIEKETFPLYVLFLEIDPARVDVNVHPTKQEVKFEDDRLLYSYLQAAVKHALASNNIAPSLDFTLNTQITSLPAVQRPVTEHEVDKVQSGYLQHTFSDRNQAHLIEKKDSLRQWKELYEVARIPEMPMSTTNAIPVQVSIAGTEHTQAPAQGNQNKLLIHGTYLATTVKSGMMLIHLGRAQERIWFERLLHSWNNRETAVSQQVLFPMQYDFSPQDTAILLEVMPDLARIGLEISNLGKQTFVVQGVPSGLKAGEEKEIIENVIEHIKNESPNAVNNRMEMILARVAKTMARGSDNLYQPAEQQALIDELFASGQPEYSPSGKKIFVLVRKDEIENMLG
jgi:DNA mismatch repair protein MutL